MTCIVCACSCVVNKAFFVTLLFQVDIEINGQTVDLRMKLGDGGTAYFVQEVDTSSEVCIQILNFMWYSI